jgi:hypothetical protein
VLDKNSDEYRRIALIMNKDLQDLYKKNTLFFTKIKHPYFTKFSDYNPKRLRLKLSEKGYINLFNTNTGKEVYPEDPSQYAQKQATEFLKKRPHFIITEKASYQGHIETPYTDYMTRTTDKYNQLTPKIIQADEHLVEQLFMFGSGLCLQLQYVLNALDVRNLIIFEPDEDAIYNSLYVVDWEQILGYFNREGYNFTIYDVTDNDKNISTIYSVLIKKGFHRCSKIDKYFHYGNNELYSLYSNLQYYLMHTLGGVGFFDDELLGLEHSAQNIRNNVPHSVKHLTLQARLCDKPVLVIGNGPSLDGLEHFIKSRLDQFVLISCGSALGSLIKKGIIPDIHVEQERLTDVKDVLLDNTTQAVRDQIFFVGLNTCYQEVFSLFENQYMVMKPNDLAVDLLKKNQSDQFVELQYCNPLVSNFGLSVAIMLGFKDIYLAAVDCGMIDASKHHSKQSIYYSHEDKKTYEYNKLKTHSIKGNLRDQVLTDALYDNSRITLELTLDEYKPNCYNLSDGAYIRGAEPKLTEFIHDKPLITNKKTLIKSLLDNCFSSEQLDIEEMNVELQLLQNNFNKTCNEIESYFKITGLNYDQIANNFDLVEKALKNSSFRSNSINRLLGGSLRGIMVNITAAKKVLNDRDFSIFYKTVVEELAIFFEKIKLLVNKNLVDELEKRLELN